MKTLRLAVFNTQPPHLYYGGVERRIIEVAKKLRGTVNTDVYSGTKKKFHRPSRIDGVTFIPCISTDLFFPLDNWCFNRTLARNFDSFRADVYESHTVSGYGFLKAMKKHGVKKPFIETVHGVLADEYAQSFKGELPNFRAKLSNSIMRKLSGIEHQTARDADLIVTVSRYSMGKIVKFYDVDKTKIRIVPNGVDVKKFKPIEGCENVKRRIGVNGKPCVLFVGKLIPRKGLHFLMEAAKLVVKENKETTFVLVGGGPLRDNLIAQTRKEGLSGNFFFLGVVPDDFLPLIYNCADVFALPSIQEGQGMALLEAQATSKPVVAFKVGGVTDIVLDKQTGLLVEPDASELAKALLTLLSDESLRDKLGRHGKRFVSENFSWNTSAQKMFKVYSEAMNTYSSGASA